MMAIELVTDKSSKESFMPDDPFLDLLQDLTRREGLLIRNLGSNLIISPPLVFSKENVDELAGMLIRAFNRALPDFNRR